jgi:hypothetical protein
MPLLAVPYGRRSGIPGYPVIANPSGEEYETPPLAGFPMIQCWLPVFVFVLKTMKTATFVRLTALLTYKYELLIVTACDAYVVVPDPTPRTRAFADLSVQVTTVVPPVTATDDANDASNHN